MTRTAVQTRHTGRSLLIAVLTVLLIIPAAAAGAGNSANIADFDPSLAQH